MAQSSKKTAKIKDNQVGIILKKYANKINIDDIRIGKVSKNGKNFTYKRAFCEFISKEYGVTIQAIERLIRINVQKE